jgi:hypothetical protein
MTFSPRRQAVVSSLSAIDHSYALRVWCHSMWIRIDSESAS